MKPKQAFTMLELLVVVSLIGGLINTSSFHEYGANVCFADGSVKFISGRIDFQGDGGVKGGASWTDITTTGPSRHGVWGALGTRDSGENVRSALMGCPANLTV